MIKAKIIADSISSVNGKRLTTFEVEFPRYILAEYNTHRAFSRNAASTRAIPILKQLENITTNPALPVFYGKSRAGMQAKEELDEESKEAAKSIILDMMEYCKKGVEKLESLGLHKQHAGRYIEPWSWVKGVISSTEFDNFFWLRCHEDAQPEIKELADCMYKAYSQNIPQELQPGEWHTPYVSHKNDVDGNCSYYIDFNGETITLSLEEALKVSSSCCAQVSFRALDNSLEKACKIYDMLVESKPVHASPFEHQGTPISEGQGSKDDNAITHRDKFGRYWSGNFCGWNQYRQLIPENTCWEYS